MCLCLEETISMSPTVDPPVSYHCHTYGSCYFLLQSVRTLYWILCHILLWSSSFGPRKKNCVCLGEKDLYWIGPPTLPQYLFWGFPGEIGGTGPPALLHQQVPVQVLPGCREHYLPWLCFCSIWLKSWSLDITSMCCLTALICGLPFLWGPSGWDYLRSHSL